MDLRTAQSILQQEINRRTAVEYLIQAVEAAAQSEEKARAADAELERLKGAIRNAEAEKVKAVADTASAKARADEAIKGHQERVNQSVKAAADQVTQVQAGYTDQLAALRAQYEAAAAEEAQKANTMIAGLDQAVTLAEQKLDVVLEKVRVAEARLVEVQTLIGKLKEI